MSADQPFVDCPITVCRVTLERGKFVELAAKEHEVFAVYRTGANLLGGSNKLGTFYSEKNAIAFAENRRALYKRHLPNDVGRFRVVPITMTDTPL